MLLLFGIGTPVASAAPAAEPGWAYKSNFGEGLNFVFEFPHSPVAVDSNGNVFAADQNSGQVSVYAPGADGGTPLTSLYTGGRNVAVDLSDDTVYADGVLGDPIKRYVSDGAPTPTYTLDPTFSPVTQGAGIAVDPTTGDLLVADPGAEGVRRYDSTGTPLETIATPSIGPAWIATAPDGSFYVAPSEGPDVTHFSGAGTLLGTLSEAGSVHGLAYDASRSLVVVAAGGQILAYSSAGALLGKTPSQSGGGVGLAIGASGSLYQAEGNVAYYAPGTRPGVEAPQVSDLDVYSAHVSAEVDPGAGPPAGSVAHFEVSADGGQTWPISTPDVPVKRTESAGPDILKADLDLEGNTDYLIRLVASNSVITVTSGTTDFHTLLGPPVVETGPAVSITDTKAELTGTIDTLGDQTTFHFEYGLTAAYGSEVPAGAEGVAGNERGPRSFSRGISGLQPDTTYHYRLVAANAAGEGMGADRTFTTGGAGATRAYEQVSPRNKMGGSISPQLGFQAAVDGSGLAYQLGQAPADAAGVSVFSRVLSRRSSTGWLDWKPLDPPINAAVNVTTTVTHAISPDFTHALVVSNRILTPVGPNGPYADGGNIYLQDLDTGEYTFVGGNPVPGEYGAFEMLAGFSAESLYIAGAPDFSWVVFSSIPALLPGVSARAVYKWSREGGLEVESRLPDDSIPMGQVSAPNNYERDPYRQASNDGSVIYFSLDTWEGGVYRRAGGQTTAISVSQIPGDPVTVQGGRFEGGSDDGRYAFFRSTARLSSDAPTDPSGAYLYRYDAQRGALEFVGLVDRQSFSSGEDIWGVGDDGQVVYYEPANLPGTWVWNHGVNTQMSSEQIIRNSRSFGNGISVFTSPNGQYMAYYGTDRTVHLYDAEAGEDVCASCGSGDDRGRLPNGTRSLSNRPPEVVNNEGELYFDTKNSLIVEDRNATYDVYQYQDGQLTLISPGDAPYNARFGDVTPNGSDVFFVTDQGLVPGDLDEGLDVYDARVGGGFPESVSVPGCEAEACRPPIGRPPDLESPKGGDSTGADPFAISNLRPLSSADRKKLAKGGMARLRLTVSRPGTVKLTGIKVDSSPVKVKKSGAISVPFSLTKPALAELGTRGRLPIKLSVHFGDAHPKVVRLTLNAVATKKGGRS